MLLSKYYHNDEEEEGGVENDNDHHLDHYHHQENDISIQDLEQQLLLELRDPVGTMAVHRQLVEVDCQHDDYDDYMVTMTMLVNIRKNH